MSAEDFWKPWEETATTFDGVVEFIEKVQDKWMAKHQMRFAWRGQVDATWPLHSSLYRRLMLSKGSVTAPVEKDLWEIESEVLSTVRSWGLHSNDGTPLPVLSQLALLQHYGAPTRLIDITFNAWIGVWFAVEEKWSNGQQVHEKADGRLFAIEVTDRLINSDEDRRTWEFAQERPWPAPPAAGRRRAPDPFCGWTTSVCAWKPTAFDKRIAAQNGGFLLGGVPATQKPGSGSLQWPTNATAGNAKWRIDEVRQFTSVAVRAHKAAPVAGVKPSNVLLTLRIDAGAKAPIRDRLRALCGYEHATIYPDFSGFASFATPSLKGAP